MQLLKNVKCHRLNFINISKFLSYNILIMQYYTNQSNKSQYTYYNTSKTSVFSYKHLLQHVKKHIQSYTFFKMTHNIFNDVINILNVVTSNTIQETRFFMKLNYPNQNMLLQNDSYLHIQYILFNKNIICIQYTNNRFH